MKKMFGQLLCAAAAMFAAACALAASPPAEQVPRPQTLQQQTALASGVVMGDMMAAQQIQHQGLLQQQLNQRQEDPPVSLDTVLPKGGMGYRMPWSDTAIASAGMTKLGSLAVSGLSANGGGSGCINDRRPKPGPGACDKLPFRQKMNV